MRLTTTALMLCVLAATPLTGAEYFVARQGSDAHDGLAMERAFATLQRGLDALAPGDTLTIAPGEYFGSVRRDDLGDMENDTVIRAVIPGTVLLRGDVAAPSFEPVAGHPRLYAADFIGDVQMVSEVDTLSTLASQPTVPETGFTPGSFHHDAAAGKLYVSPTDLRPAETHHYSVALTGTHGLHLVRPRRVIVDGLAARGFHSIAQLPDYDPQNVPWGIYLAAPVNCVVRNCTAFLNGGGILVMSSNGGGNLIENCTGYGNSSPHSEECGNVVIFHTNNDVIRNCVGYRSKGTGVRIYGLSKGDGLIEKSLGWGNGLLDLGTKGGGEGVVYRVRNSVALGILPAYNLGHSLVGKQALYLEEKDVGRDNILLKNERVDWQSEFVDPVNFDFRLQSSSRFRGAAPDGGDRGPFPYRPNVFFVRQDGDDAADGLSAAGAWRSPQRAVRDLAPGDTVYLEGGVYGGALVIRAGSPGAEPVALRGRGTARVVLAGGVTVEDSRGVSFERLDFTGPVRVDASAGVWFNNCRFFATGVGLEARRTDELRVTHCEFTGFTAAGLRLEDSERASVAGNIFDNGRAPAIRDEVRAAGSARAADSVLYSDYNAYRDGDTAWLVAGVPIPLGSLPPGQDAYSRVIEPDYASDGEGVMRLRERTRFLAAGPLGKPAGRHQDLPGDTLHMTAPVVHAVSDTTADLEWLVSRGSVCELAWGETADCENKVTYTVATFNDRHRTFSLTGLKPDTTYYFRVASIRLLSYPDYGQPEVVAPEYGVISFTTRREPAAPRTYYVAPDGHDENTGLARGQAWRTVGRAAASAGPGDTVLVAGGNYIEKVRVRRTGDDGRPVTFRNIPGEKVVFDGNNRRVQSAFVINGKRNIVLDGFYFRGIGMEGGGNVSQRVVNVNQGRDVTIRRCLWDGRGAGYSPGFLTAFYTENLLVSNCVLIRGFDGLEVTSSPGFRVENSVFLATMIQNVKLSTEARLSGNIFCDSSPGKVGVALQQFGRQDAVSDRNNCYFVRVPDEERKLFWVLNFNEGGLNLGHTRMGLAEYNARVAPSDSFLADPLFAVLGRLERDKLAAFYPDSLGNAAIPLDFPDLFSDNPVLQERGVGLQPEAFADFRLDG